MIVVLVEFVTRKTGAQIRANAVSVQAAVNVIVEILETMVTATDVGRDAIRVHARHVAHRLAVGHYRGIQTLERRPAVARLTLAGVRFDAGLVFGAVVARGLAGEAVLQHLIADVADADVR